MQKIRPVPVRGMMNPVKTSMFNKRFRRDLLRFFVVSLFLLFGSAHASAAVPLSTVNIGIAASAADLAAIVNQSLPVDLYKGQAGLGTTVTVSRTGPVVMTANDNFICFTVPVQLIFRYTVYESYPLRTELRFKARASVTPDWRLKTDLYYTGLSDNLADTFKLGPLKLKPKSMIEAVIDPVQKMLAPYLDAKINESVQLRAKIDPVWKNAFSPVLVSKEFSTWLKLTPEKIYMTPITTAGNQIRLAIGMITGAEITVGPKPAAAGAKILPPLQLYQTFDKRFYISLAADIFYADLVEALKPVLINKTFGEDKKVTIKNFNLKGENGRLAVMMAATGDFEGELTLLARPVYHPQNNVLTFENVDFDTRNAGWLISAGSWLLNSTIRNTIKTRLDAAVIEQLEKVRLKASQALSCVQVAEHVKLSGAVRSLALGETAVQNDRLSIPVIVQGELGVILK